MVLAILVLGATIAAGTKLVVGAIEIRETDTPSDSTTAALPETGPNLGRSTTVDAAGAALGFDVLVPAELGEPDGVFIDGDASHVSLTWLPDGRLPRIPGTPWGAILIEFGGDEVQAVKSVLIDGAEWVDAGGVRGYWLAEPHVLQLADGTTFRVRGNVLIFQRGRTTLRLESGLDQAAAIRLPRRSESGGLRSRPPGHSGRRRPRRSQAAPPRGDPGARRWRAASRRSARSAG